MAWLILGAAGILEIVWAVGMKYSNGFTRPTASAVTIAAMIASFVLLEKAIRTIPVGTGYAVWTGIGAAGTAFLGIILFAEPATLTRLGCIGLILAGITGLKLTAS